MSVNGIMQLFFPYFNSLLCDCHDQPPSYIIYLFIIDLTYPTASKVTKCFTHQSLGLFLTNQNWSLSLQKNLAFWNQNQSLFRAKRTRKSFFLNISNSGNQILLPSSFYFLDLNEPYMFLLNSFQTSNVFLCCSNICSRSSFSQFCFLLQLFSTQ